MIPEFHVSLDCVCIRFALRAGFINPGFINGIDEIILWS